MRIAVLASGSGTNLQALIDASLAGYFKSNIQLVISNKPKAYALTRAKEANIKTIVIKTDQEILEALKDNDIDLVVLAGYMKVISEEVIKTYENKMINIHPSLLPAYGGYGMYGIHVHEKVFQEKAKNTGATVHYVTYEVDAGPIIIQEKIDIDYDKIKSPEMLQQAVLDIEYKILKESIRILENNN